MAISFVVFLAFCVVCSLHLFEPDRGLCVCALLCSRSLFSRAVALCVLSGNGQPGQAHCWRRRSGGRCQGNARSRTLSLFEMMCPDWSCPFASPSAPCQPVPLLSPSRGGQANTRSRLDKLLTEANLLRTRNKFQDAIGYGPPLSCSCPRSWSLAVAPLSNPPLSSLSSALLCRSVCTLPPVTATVTAAVVQDL
jgi:hypothetical protein